MLLRSFSAPSLLYFVHSLPHPFSSTVYSERTHWFFPGISHQCFFFSKFKKIRKASRIVSSFFSLNFLRFFFHPYWKTVLNSGCTIVELCFGLGLYHHKSNSKPTHTDYDFVGQSNGFGSLYLWLLRDF